MPHETPATDVGLALAATRLPLMIFVLYGGVMADRLSRRALMLASDSGRFITQAVVAALLISGEARFWELLVLFGLNGFAQASFWGALWTTTMQREIPGNALSRVAAYSQLGSLVLGALGYAGVGFVAESIGLSTTLWVGAAWIIASTAIVVSVPALRGYRAMIVEPEASHPTKRGKPTTSPRIAPTAISRAIPDHSTSRVVEALPAAIRPENALPEHNIHPKEREEPADVQDIRASSSWSGWLKRRDVRWLALNAMSSCAVL